MSTDFIDHQPATTAPPSTPPPVNRITDLDPDSPAPKRPVSDKKLAANRLNAQKSTGPRTDEGKKTVSQNARKHGCSAAALLPSECDATYEIFQAELEEELRPRSAMQSHLVTQISQILWKLQRVPDAERHLFALNTKGGDEPLPGCQTLANAFHASPTRNDFLLFERYQRQLRNSYLRLLSQLRTLQKDPPPAYDESFERRDLTKARKMLEDALLNRETDPPDTHINLCAPIPCLKVEDSEVVVDPSPANPSQPHPPPQTTNNEQQTPRREIKPTESRENPDSASESPPSAEKFDQTNPTSPPLQSQIENRKSPISLPVLQPLAPRSAYPDPVSMLRRLFPILLLFLLSFASRTSAHNIVENALDVVIHPDKVVIDARIVMEEVIVMEASAPPPREAWQKLAAKHQPYLLSHLKIEADGQKLTGTSVIEPTIAPGPTDELNAANYRLEYPLQKPPQMVSVYQDLLREKTNWQCSAVVRIRRSDIPVFQSALLTTSRSIEFDLDWPPNPTTAPTTAPAQSPPMASVGHIRTEVPLWATIRAYTEHGIAHILTGFDHLLFVGALVLAAASFWDLIKVVTAFTLAHTLTLTLSVLNLLTLSSRIVEPMIAASIIFVAVQNIFWPRQSRGWSRLAIAFAFGLFHGLGFAGGLKQAMSQMPVTALGIALVSFSLGVEIGHQFLVIPLFVILRLFRKAPGDDRELPHSRILKLGSAAISIAGIYFLVQAIR